MPFIQQREAELEEALTLIKSQENQIKQLKEVSGAVQAPVSAALALRACPHHDPYHPWLSSPSSSLARLVLLLPSPPSPHPLGIIGTYRS